MKKTILVLHAADIPVRMTMINHLTAVPRYVPNYTYVFHHVNAPLTEGLMNSSFDAVIINYCFISFLKLRSDINRTKYSFLRNWEAVKIAIVQDDYTRNQIIDDWIVETKIDVVYSAIEDGLDYLYKRSFLMPNIKFRMGLTGYTDSQDFEKYDRVRIPWEERTMDVGTRVRMLPAFYGRHGLLKGKTAESFGRIADEAGFVVDVSTDPKDVIPGNKWFDFLANCRFSIGVKGGASLADPIGQIKIDVDAFTASNPEASFDEIEAACFPGEDMVYRFEAISPRLFECAILENCQILIGDDWPGGLVAGEDFILLEEDLSNVEEVFETMRDHERCRAIAASCRRKLVDDGIFDYSLFAKDIISQIERVEAGRVLPATSDGQVPLCEEHVDCLAPFEVLRKILGGLVLRSLTRVLNISQKQGNICHCAQVMRNREDNSWDLESYMRAVAVPETHMDFMRSFNGIADLAAEAGPEYTQALTDVLNNFEDGTYFSPEIAHFDGIEIWYPDDPEN
ncbi:MAG: hypothetical protein ACPGGK_04015 [Pikeienuella sp.]